MSQRGAAELIADRLSAVLGPNTARVAVRTFSANLGLAAESVTRKEAPRLLEALRPVLKTLLGAAESDALLRSVASELSIDLPDPERTRT